MSTKKVRSAGRFGARYGVGVRKRVVGVESVQRQKHVCPYCGLGTVKRLNTGVFECKKCRTAFSGGAYLPQTMTGAIVKKMVEQRAFSPTALKELLETTEKAKHHAPEAAPAEAEAEAPAEEKAPAETKKRKAPKKSRKAKPKTKKE